jgi:outer membrane protein
MSTLRCFCAVLLVCGGVLWGQVPTTAEPVLELSLEKAIEMALSTKGNTSVQLGQESIRFAHAQFVQARSDLLPKVDAIVTEQNLSVNIRALGVQFPPNPQNFQAPVLVGPFYTFDVRPRLTQTVLNLPMFRRTQAAHADVHAAEAESKSIQQRTAATVARLYAAALRANADVETGKVNVSLAETLRDRAKRRESVGEGTALDSTRSELSVSRNQQRLLAAQTALIRANLDLINVLNIGWNTTLRLSGELGATAEPITAEQAVEIALKSRADFTLEQRRLESARLNHSAAQLERLPSINGYADYGRLNGELTHIVGASLRLPLFDNRLEAERAQTMSLQRQVEIRQQELRNRVELEIRQALATLASAQSQLQVADHAAALAEDELGRARRRYESGLANSVEVVDAETRLENARNDRVAAQFTCTEARIDLAQAMGTITTISF